MGVPICVTEYGEMIGPYPQHSRNLDHDVPDDAPIKEAQHLLCGGLVSLHQVSRDWQALTCKACSLRVYLPISLKTYADLRQHCAKYAWFVSADATT